MDDSYYNCGAASLLQPADSSSTPSLTSPLHHHQHHNVNHQRFNSSHGAADTSLNFGADPENSNNNMMMIPGSHHRVTAAPMRQHTNSNAFLSSSSPSSGLDSFQYSNTFMTSDPSFTTSDPYSSSSFYSISNHFDQQQDPQQQQQQQHSYSSSGLTCDASLMSDQSSNLYDYGSDDLSRYLPFNDVQQGSGCSGLNLHDDVTLGPGSSMTWNQDQSVGTAGCEGTVNNSMLHQLPEQQQQHYFSGSSSSSIAFLSSHRKLPDIRQINSLHAVNQPASSGNVVPIDYSNMYSTDPLNDYNTGSNSMIQRTLPPHNPSSLLPSSPSTASASATVSMPVTAAVRPMTGTSRSSLTSGSSGMRIRSNGSSNCGVGDGSSTSRSSFLPNQLHHHQHPISSSSNTAAAHFTPPTSLSKQHLAMNQDHHQQQQFDDRNVIYSPTHSTSHSLQQRFQQQHHHRQAAGTASSSSSFLQQQIIDPYQRSAHSNQSSDYVSTSSQQTQPAFQSIRSQLRIGESEEEEIFREPELEQVSYLYQQQQQEFGNNDAVGLSDALSSDFRSERLFSDPDVLDPGPAPEAVDLRQSDDSKWIFDMDKGWVIRESNVSHSNRKREKMKLDENSSLVSRLQKHQRTTASGRRESDDYELMADHPNKGLGAKLAAVLGEDVITIIGSKPRSTDSLRNEKLGLGLPHDEGEDDEPPPPAPDFPDDNKHRPGSASSCTLKRGSPVSPDKKPNINRKGRNASPVRTKGSVSKESKKEMWKNSTKAEAMLWSTVDEDVMDDGEFYQNENEDVNRKGNVNDVVFDQEIGCWKQAGDMTTAADLKLNLTTSSQYMTDQSSERNSIYTSVSSSMYPASDPNNQQQQQQQLLGTRKLPILPAGGQKRNSIERQNEIVIPPTVVSSSNATTMSMFDDPTSQMMRRGSFQMIPDMTAGVTSVSSAVSSSSLMTHDPMQQGVIGGSSRRGSFNATLLVAGEQVKVPGIGMNLNQGQHVMQQQQQTLLSPGMSVALNQAVMDQHSLQQKMQLQQQQDERSSMHAPIVTICGPVVTSSSSNISTYSMDNERIVPPPIMERRGSFNRMTGTASPTKAQQLPTIAQQQQVPPPSALRTESNKIPGEVKTVTFSDQLHQERTFNPSNASSPFPLHEQHQHQQQTSTDLMFQQMAQVDDFDANRCVGPSSLDITGCMGITSTTMTMTSASSAGDRISFSEQQQQKYSDQQQQQQYHQSQHAMDPHLMNGTAIRANGSSANLLNTTTTTAGTMIQPYGKEVQQSDALLHQQQQQQQQQHLLQQQQQQFSLSPSSNQLVETAVEVMVSQQRRRSSELETALLPDATIKSGTTTGGLSSYQQQQQQLQQQAGEKVTVGGRTTGLREYEPEFVQGMTVARVRWLAAFNKIASEMQADEVSIFFSLLTFPLLLASCYKHHESHPRDSMIFLFSVPFLSFFFTSSF